MTTTPEASLAVAEALKPCPFCGGEAKDNGHPRGIMGQIYCSSDDCFGPITTAGLKEDSVKQWNTRATPTDTSAGERGIVQPSTATKPTSSRTEASATETALDILEENCWDLRCVDIPTGAGDADIGWEIVEHHMTPPKDRIVGYGNSPIEAIRDALDKVKPSDAETDARNRSESTPPAVLAAPTKESPAPQAKAKESET